jgi:hypothetical protein
MLAVSIVAENAAGAGQASLDCAFFATPAAIIAAGGTPKSNPRYSPEGTSEHRV